MGANQSSRQEIAGLKTQLQQCKDNVSRLQTENQNNLNTHVLFLKERELVFSAEQRLKICTDEKNAKELIIQRGSLFEDGRVIANWLQIKHRCNMLKPVVDNIGFLSLGAPGYLQQPIWALVHAA